MIAAYLQRRAARHFDLPAIRDAIEAAERQTTAEIRVSIAPICWGDLENFARKAFRRLGMDHTRQRNAVLILVVPLRRKFYIYGDEGIHARAGQELWDRAAAILTSQFRTGQFTAGLIEGIAELGRTLAQHFPGDGISNENELPNDISFEK